jgi:hypothetical protein
MERFFFKKSRKFFSISDIKKIHPLKWVCQALFAKFLKKILSAKTTEILNISQPIAYVPTPDPKKR